MYPCDMIVTGDDEVEKMQSAATDAQERNRVLLELIQDEQWRAIDRLLEKDCTPIEVEPEIVRTLAHAGEKVWPYARKILHEAHSGQVRLADPLDIETDSGYDWSLILM